MRARLRRRRLSSSSVVSASGSDGAGGSTRTPDPVGWRRRPMKSHAPPTRATAPTATRPPIMIDQTKSVPSPSGVGGRNGTAPADGAARAEDDASGTMGAGDAPDSPVGAAGFA